MRFEPNGARVSSDSLRVRRKANIGLRLRRQTADAEFTREVEKLKG